MQQNILRYDRDQAARHRLDVVIRDLKQAVLEIEELARNVEGDDLPRTVAEDLLTERKALDQHSADAGRLAFPGQISVTLKLLVKPREVDDCGLVLVSQRNPAVPSSEQWSE